MSDKTGDMRCKIELENCFKESKQHYNDPCYKCEHRHTELSKAPCAIKCVYYGNGKEELKVKKRESPYDGKGHTRECNWFRSQGIESCNCEGRANEK